MKDIKEFLKSKHNSFDIEYWSKENYLLSNIKEFYNGDIPENIKEKLLNDEFVDYIYENLQSHDPEKLKSKLKREYGNEISFQDYNGKEKKSFIMILNNDNLLDFYNPKNNPDADYEKIEKFNNILSFYNYYVSYNDEDKGKKYLFIEPRYSDNVTDEVFNSHKYLYHFTDKKSSISILEVGLRARKSNYREYPERIFLYASDKKIDENNIKDFADFILRVCNPISLKRNGLRVLEIKNTGKIDLYNDTAMTEDEAVFTYQNIPHDYIKKLNIDLSYDELIKYIK